MYFTETDEYIYKSIVILEINDATVIIVIFR